MNKDCITRAGFLREWEGDISDLGNMLYAHDESEIDKNENWHAVYYLTNEQIAFLETGGFLLNA